MKIPGGKSGSVDRLKKEMKKATGGNVWVRYVKAGEDMTVRFLTEPGDWYAYREHYSKDVNFFPCVGEDNDCPGCESDNEQVKSASRRFLANALEVETGRVIALKLPLDLANRLVARYERYGDTIVDRDYTLHRMGTGLETSYDVTPETQSVMDTSRFDLVDLEKALVDQFEDAFDIGDDEEDTPRPPTKASKRRTKVVEDTDEDTDDDLDNEVPSEPSTSADEGDDEGYLTESQALKMSRDELTELAKQYDVKVKTTMNKQEMVDAIFSAAE
jgi:hypothetical protein